MVCRSDTNSHCSIVLVLVGHDQLLRIPRALEDFVIPGVCHKMLALDATFEAFVLENVFKRENPPLLSSLYHFSLYQHPQPSCS